MALGLAGILFLIFAANVVMGSAAGAPFMGDVSEMLVLFGASVAFVAAILNREARRKANDQDQTEQGGGQHGP